MLAPTSGAQATVSGGLTQLAGRGGCVQAGTPERCSAGRGLRGADFVTVSRDDRFVYAVSFDAISIFERAGPGGRLAQLADAAGCLDDGKASTQQEGCATTRGTYFAEGTMLALSPDGRNAYLAHAAGVATFARDRATGALSQLPGMAGCTLPTRTSTCAHARGIQAPQHVAVSPDGRNVYVAAFNSAAVAVFSRDRTTGALSQPPGRAGCVSVRRDEGCARGRALFGAQQLAIGQDGRNVYLAAQGGLSAFARDTQTGGLRQLPGRSGCLGPARWGCAVVRRQGQEAFSVALGPSGRDLYVGSTTCGGPPVGICSGSVTTFKRDRRTGALSRLRGRAGCTSERGERGCATGRALAFVHSLAVSRDGRSVYAAGGTNLAVFRRAPRTGALAQLRGRDGVARGRGLGDSRSVALSFDGRSVYAASKDVDALAIFLRSR